MLLRGFGLYGWLITSLCLICLVPIVHRQRQLSNLQLPFKYPSLTAPDANEDQKPQEQDIGQVSYDDLIRLPKGKTPATPDALPTSDIKLLLEATAQQGEIDVSGAEQVHEIVQLHLAAKSNQAAKLQRQSKTLDEAVKEYRRRYAIAPPPGYDAWFAYAQEAKSVVMDDFDDLMNGLKPFRAFQTASCDFDDLKGFNPAILKMCIFNGTLTTGRTSQYDSKQIVIPMTDFLSEFIVALPEMCFDVNTFDEPRQLIPVEKILRLLAYNATEPCEQYSWEQHKREDVWPEIKTPCQAKSPAGSGYLDSHPPPISYVEDWKEATELCDWTEAPPSGMIRAPENLAWTNTSRPLLSAATLSTYSDIMFPTLWRWRFNIDDEKSIRWADIIDTTPWSEKVGRVGWRGSSTGGYSSGDNWRQFQRHQMVALAKLSPVPALGLRLRNPQQLQAWLDVQFTSIVGCEQKTCKVLEALLPPAPSQSLAETFRNKIVLDMDGHGLSGRFYMLLQSDSAVMKQGLVREWHDDRLVPWLHYIPLSMNMRELERVLTFFLGNSSEGDTVLKAIADEGKAWVRQALRKEDMRIYMYRLLLELGRRNLEPN